MSDPLRQIIARNRAGLASAIPSVCSAHPDVLRASLRLAERKDVAVVIEATSNQVNQDGGYTGLTPAAFISFVNGLADETRTDRGRIIFGGDHLGPQAWRKLPVEQAMAKGTVAAVGVAITVDQQHFLHATFIGALHLDMQAQTDASFARVERTVKMALDLVLPLTPPSTLSCTAKLPATPNEPTLRTLPMLPMLQKRHVKTV